MTAAFLVKLMFIKNWEMKANGYLMVVIKTEISP